jgi:hypothetical protein
MAAIPHTSSTTPPILFSFTKTVQVIAAHPLGLNQAVIPPTPTLTPISPFLLVCTKSGKSPGFVLYRFPYENDMKKKES